VLPRDLVSYVAYWSVTDDDRQRQAPESKAILAPYTRCRRASSKAYFTLLYCNAIVVHMTHDKSQTGNYTTDAEYILFYVYNVLLKHTNKF